MRIDFEKYGIRLPKQKYQNIDEVLEFDYFPCVLKIEGNYHKSDLGAVVTHINNPEELNLAKEEILKNLKKHGIVIKQFLIQEELDGVEFFVGGKYDQLFEEVILFGKGGVLVEVDRDICYIDADANRYEIKKAIKKTKISKLFPGFRGKTYDIQKAVDIVKSVQNLLKNEDIIEFDINPLIYHKGDFVGVDIRYKVGEKVRNKFYKKSYSLFDNKNIAIIGASEKPEKVGYALAKNSLESDANIFFVNPKLKTLFDKKVYLLEELKDIDTAVIDIHPEYVLNTIKELTKKGCKNFIVISAGYKEAGNKEGEIELKKFAEKENINIVGPNCLGMYNSKSNLNLTFAKSKIHEGNIGLISQSGAVLTALIDKAYSKKIGFSHIISLGNIADFNFVNAIEELNLQDSCKIISIYIEGLEYGKDFLNAVRKSKKPILILKSGKSNQAKKAAMSHTGNLCGDYEMIVDLSEIAGATVVSSMEELIFHKRVDEVVIVTNAGGPGTLLTDLVVGKGKKLVDIGNYMDNLNKVLPFSWSHNNPIDVIGDATDQRYKDTLEIVKNEKLIFVIITPQYMTDVVAITKILKEYDQVIPIFLGDESFKEAKKVLDGRVYFSSLEEAVKIL